MDLFSEEPDSLSPLQNEIALARACPLQFWLPNPWSSYSSHVSGFGGAVAHWKWRDFDPAEKAHRLFTFQSVVGRSKLPHSAKIALAGWMLSEMLIEPPTLR